MKISNLALAGIRNGKGAAASLFALIFVASLLLNIGISVISNINTFYNDKVDELYDPHVAMVMGKEEYQARYGEFFRNYNGVVETESEDVVLLNSAAIRYGGSEMDFSAIMMNADAIRGISPLKLTEKLETAHGDTIYLPYSFKANGDYKLGDSIVISYQEHSFTYRIAGFFEATMLGTNNMGMIKFFLPGAVYHQVSEQLGQQTEAVLLSAVLADRSQSTQLFNDYKQQFPGLETGGALDYYWGADVELVKVGNTITVNIVGMILVAFAAVIVIVSLIVIKFRVANSIEDGMVNIGVLKAVGYTSWQILASIVLQFMLVALCAGVVGIAASYLVMPTLGSIISSLSGLLWKQSFDPAINVASILIVIALVLAVSLISSLRIRKLPPVAALRGGIQTHSFRKNWFPLHKAKGGLLLALAGKTMTASRKQNAMIALIMAAITFAAAFSIVLYYNIAQNKTAFIHLVGSETTNVMVIAKTGVDTAQLQSAIERMEGVSKISVLDLITTRIDGQSLYTEVSDDYGKLNNNTAYEGRHPKFDNEISVSWVVSNLLQKGIGDTVEVEGDNTSGTYVITGLSQSINNMGQVVSMTQSGIRQLIPDYKSRTINIYLDHTDNASFIREFKAQYGDLTELIYDVDETIESQTSNYVSTVTSIMVMILAITVFVVALIMYLVVKTMILKRRREFGIMKAIGYTTFQLMTQTALSFVPVVIVGVGLGGLLGALYSNSILTLLLSGAGVRNAQFYVHIPIIVILCAGVIVLAYLVSMLVSWRIKSITAYSLITE